MKRQTDHKNTDELTSVISTPNRCRDWGCSSYQGNCDGTLIQRLILHYQATRVADPMMGSGTTRDVVLSLNSTGDHEIDFWGSDLREGFDLQRSTLPRQANFIFLHPPYWNIIRYSDDPRDLSTLVTYEDYVAALEHCLENSFASLTRRGYIAILVGDVRRYGIYIPIIQDVLNLGRKKGTLRSVIIKTQHNCSSDFKRYPYLQDPRIAHEYCAVFQSY